MPANRIVGIVVRVAGVVLLVMGLQATDSIGEKLHEGLTGRYTDNTTWYIVGGIAAIVAIYEQAFVKSRREELGIVPTIYPASPARHAPHHSIRIGLIQGLGLRSHGNVEVRPLIPLAPDFGPCGVTPPPGRGRPACPPAAIPPVHAIPVRS